jgi:hypothetical protein
MSDYLSGSNEAWVRYYVYVLAGDERWQRLLKDDDPAERELRDDAEEWYPGILRLGRVARALSELARGGLPQDRVEAQAVLDRVAGLAEQRELEVVEQRAEAIRTLAREALAHFFDGAARSAVVSGSFESLADGRVRLAYEFDAEEETADFVRRPGYLGNWRESLVELERSEAESSFAVDDGAFGGIGSLCYVHRFELTAPIRLTVRVRYGSGARGGDIAFLWLGLCDDGEEAFILCGSDGGMSVSDPATRYFEHTTDDKPYDVDPSALQELVIDHTGDKVETFLNGEPRYEIGAGPRKSGTAFVMTHSNVSIELASFEIVGHLAPGQLERLQAEWIESELVRRGW